MCLCMKRKEIPQASKKLKKLRIIFSLSKCCSKIRIQIWLFCSWTFWFLKNRIFPFFQDLSSEIAFLRDSLSRVELELSTSLEIQDHQFKALENIALGLGENLNSLSQVYCQLNAVLHKFKRDAYS
jgi:hypothetical protein